jgi:hypothetical protein
MEIDKIGLGIGLFSFGNAIVWSIRIPFPFNLIFIPFIAIGSFFIASSFANEKKAEK